jgi:hypothetical protein
MFRKLDMFPLPVVKEKVSYSFVPVPTARNKREATGDSTKQIYEYT